MGWSPTRRTTLYCILVTAVAAGIYLPFLGLHPMSGDEPLYAMCVDHMRDGTPRAVLSPTPYPPVPYFQKPPLYMWLTATTYGLFPRDSVVKYRVWSAAFGTLAVTGTCLLGAALLSPEAGLIAALLLLANDDWVRNHGVLTGTFDTGLTLACLACFLMYWSWTQRKVRGWVWPAIGLVSAVASLMKPGFGVLPLGLLAAHAIFFDRRRPPREKSLGLAAALAITVAGAGWWFLLQYHRFGAEYLDQVFRRNIVGRISQGLSPHHVKQAWYYLIRVSQSSCAFTIAFLALAWAAWRAAKEDPARREPLAFLSLLGWGWIALFSISASKYLHYAYPVFPVFAVCIAGMLTAAGDRLRRRADWGATVATLCAAVLIGTDLLRMADGMSSDARRFYAPWAAAQALRPAVDAGRCRVILYGFPDSVARWMSVNALDLQAKDAFYLSHLHADRAATEDDLRRLLDRPALLITSRFNDLASLEKHLNLPARDDERFAFASDTVVTYGVDLRQLLAPHAPPGQPNPTLTATRVTDGQITLDLSPALRTGGRITVTARIPSADSDRLHYTVKTDGKLTATTRTRLAGNGVHLFTFEVDANDWATAGPTNLKISLKDPRPIEVTDVALDLDVRLGAKR